MNNYSLDSWISSNRVPVGIGLMVAGGWIISSTMEYSSLWYINLIGILALIFGSLYLFK